MNQENTSEVTIARWESIGKKYSVELRKNTVQDNVFYDYISEGSFGYLGSKVVHGLTDKKAIEKVQKMVDDGRFKPDKNMNLNRVY